MTTDKASAGGDYLQTEPKGAADLPRAAGTDAAPTPRTDKVSFWTPAIDNPNVIVEIVMAEDCKTLERELAAIVAGRKCLQPSSSDGTYCDEARIANDQLAEANARADQSFDQTEYMFGQFCIERRAREEVERYFKHECDTSSLHLQRAVAAESRLAAAVAAEREACAKVCEAVGPKTGSLLLVSKGFAESIRARTVDAKELP